MISIDSDRALEDVVPQDDRRAVSGRKALSHGERLRDTACRPLDTVGKRAAEVLAVTEAVDDGTHVLDTRDDEDLADPNAHELPQRMKKHRLSTDRQEVLIRDLGQRMKPCSFTASQNDAFHR